MKIDYVRPWSYSGYPSDLPADNFGPFESFVALWQSKMNKDGTLPQWSDFDFYDFEGWWGHINLGEIHHDPFDIYYILWGTGFTDCWGADYTNKFLGKRSTDDAFWEEAEREYFARLETDRLIGISTGSLDIVNRQYTVVQTIDLPLEKEGNVTHIMGAFVKCGPSGEFSPAVKPIITFG